MRCLIVAVLLLATCDLSAGEDDQETGQMIYKDRIYKEGGTVTCTVLHERLDHVVYHFLASPREKTSRWTHIQEIRYQGMGTGWYQAGQAQFKIGNYDAAAENFLKLANQAEREWEGAYGYYLAGRALEQAGRYQKAANAFASFAANYPEHRWYMDALYYQGINLARLKEMEAAKGVADQLIAYNEREDIRIMIGSKGQRRATAIRAAVAAAGGDMAEAQRLVMKVVFTEGEQNIAYHWKNFWANFLLEEGRSSAALSAFQELADMVGSDPERSAGCALGYGLALAQANRSEGALIELLKLDALAIGTPEQRCRAQYEAARILWEQAEAVPEDAGEKDRAFADTQRFMCRQLLKSVLNSPASIPEKEKAQFLMNEYFPPPEPEAETEGEDDAAAEDDGEAVEPPTERIPIR